jgi:hypothetical protein
MQPPDRPLLVSGRQIRVIQHIDQLRGHMKGRGEKKKAFMSTNVVFFENVH